MDVIAAVMTGQGMGAIATVQLFGDSAEAVLRKVFQRKGDRPFEPAHGRIMLGCVHDDGEIIDEVTIGCEGPCTFAIHCHGNPLIIQRVMELLQRHGVQSVPAEQLLARIFASQKTQDAIAVEAKLALTTVKTIEGATIIANQVRAGLSEKIRQWQDRLDSAPLEEIATEARDILKHSEPARLIVSGCTIALVGPPNTGKSTLLNTLAGREKAVVSDIRGTTRDWVSTEIHIPPLAATIIDTAGLDSSVASSTGVDRAAQHKSMEIVGRADLVLLILDLSQSASQVAEGLIDKLANRRSVVVLNKSDLPPQFDPAGLPGHLREVVRISAKQGTGIDDLIGAIRRACNVTDFDPLTAVVFTDRQRHLLEALHRSDSKAKARSILSELSESPLLSAGSRFPAEV